VTVICFHPDPVTTRGEARQIGVLAAERHWKSVILVTSQDHAWRARLRTRRCFAGAVYVSTTSLPALAWFRQIPYQWAATAKALSLNRIVDRSTEIQPEDSQRPPACCHSGKLTALPRFVTARGHPAQDEALY
jgi:hypothetical protein